MRIRNGIKEHEVVLSPATAEDPRVASARGKGEWKVYADGARQCKVSVTHVNLPDGSELHLAIDGRLIGEMLVQRRIPRFKRESEHGESVPAVQPSQVLQVLLAGKIILAGVFYAE